LAAAAVVLDDAELVLDVAALATTEPPSAAAPIAATATSLLRTDVGMS
jgi:hypothetical protein